MTTAAGMTNAQVALQAAATIYAASPSRGGMPQFSVQGAAQSWLAWLDEQDAKAAERELVADAQRLADRIRGGGA